MTAPASGCAWPPPMGEAAYHGVVGALVRAIEPHTEADPAALIAQTLAVAGNVIGRGPHFVVEGSRHFTNIAVVIVGDTSKGRKGTSLMRVRAPFGFVDPTWSASCVSSGLSSGEGLIYAVRDPLTKTEPVREKKRITGYQQVVIDEGVADKRLFVEESELASLLKVMERQGNTLSPVIRQAWDGGVLRTMTKNSPYAATDAHVTIIGHVTSDEVRRYLTRTELGNGFANRFLWVCSRRSKVLPDGGGPFDVDGGIVNVLREVVAFARTVIVVERDAEAADRWRDVYPALSTGRPGLLGAVTSRAEALVMRLALTYALLDRSSVIALPHLEAALEVWRYCADSVAFVFGDTIGDPVADVLLAGLRSAGRVGLTRTDIATQVFARNRRADEIDRALAALEAAGKAGKERVPTGGRPSERWIAL